MVNIFQFLQDKKGKPIPLKFKILNNLPLTGNVHIKHSLNLCEYKLTYLPDNMSIDGYLDINSTNISELPANLYVGCSLYCYGTPLANNIKNDTSLLNKYQKQVKGKIFF